MFSALCLLASSAILFYIVKYRVHVHVTYTPTTSRRVPSSFSARKRGTATEYPRQTATVPQPQEAPCPRSIGFSAASAAGGRINRSNASSDRGSASDATNFTAKLQSEPNAKAVIDIASGLVNLGAAKRPARLAAEKAVHDYPDASFDIQFSVAIQEVRAA